MNDQVCEAPMQEMPRLGEVTSPVSTRNKHPITIHEVRNGYIIAVGCNQLVFETREKMLSEIERYLKNRMQVEKEYAEKYGN